MKYTNITNARKNLYSLVEEVSETYEPVRIQSKHGNAVLVSEEDWNAMNETLYLLSFPGMREKIVDGMNTPIEDCESEENVEW